MTPNALPENSPGNAPAGGRPQAPAKLCAAFSGSLPKAELTALVQRMTAAYDLSPGQLHLVTDLPMGVLAGPVSGLAVGCTRAASPLAYRVAAAGAIYGVRQAAQVLPLAGPEPAGPGEAALAGALLLQHGAAALQRLSGVFSLAAASLDRPWALLANDRLGFSPLFYLLRDDLLLAASEVKPIAAVTDLSPDPAAYGQFFYIGHMLRHQTLYREIKALGPGQLLEWQPQGGRVHSYHDLARTPAPGSDPVPLDAINTALQQAVERAGQPVEQDTLLLSGGLDSRLLLGVLLSQGRKPRTLTLEHAGFAHGLDGQLARQVAQAARLEQDFRPTRPHFYGSADALEVFRVADGMTPSFGLFISQVYPELTPDLGRVWEGLALDLCLGGQVQHGASLRSNLPALLASRQANRRYLRQLLQRDWFQQIEASFDQELAAELERFPDSEDGWIRFQMANRKRRRVGLPPHHLYSRKVLALTPGVDAAFVDFMWSAPLQQRQRALVYGQLLLRFYPQLAGSPVLSGEHHLRIEDIAAHGLAGESGPRESLREWVKSLGLAPYARAVQARLGKVERAKTDAAPAAVVIQTLRSTGFDRPIYNRSSIEHALVRAEGGSLYWLSVLMPVFYIELWHSIFDPAALAVLRRDVFVK